MPEIQRESATAGKRRTNATEQSRRQAPILQARRRLMRRLSVLALTGLMLLVWVTGKGVTITAGLRTYNLAAGAPIRLVPVLNGRCPAGRGHCFENSNGSNRRGFESLTFRHFMKSKLFFGLAAYLVAAGLVVLLAVEVAKTKPRINPLPDQSHWSKWSTPYNTKADGWQREHGIVQYRTNLDSGLVIERNIREP
jgi:hypothetical protein